MGGDERPTVGVPNVFPNSLDGDRGAHDDGGLWVVSGGFYREKKYYVTICECEFKEMHSLMVSTAERGVSRRLNSGGESISGQWESCGGGCGKVRNFRRWEPNSIHPNA